MPAVATRPEPNGMTGQELVAFAKEYKRILAHQPELGGATEVAICQACTRPFLYNTHVRMPDTCGRDACSRGEPDQTIDWVLPPKLPRPKRTRKAKTPTAEEAPAPEPICWCSCHANVYQDRWGMIPDDIEWVQGCEHCARPV